MDASRIFSRESKLKGLGDGSFPEGFRGPVVKSSEADDIY